MLDREFTDEFDDAALVEHFDWILKQAFKDGGNPCRGCDEIRRRLTRRVPDGFLKGWADALFNMGYQAGYEYEHCEWMVKKMLSELGYTIEGEEQTDEEK